MWARHLKDCYGDIISIVLAGIHPLMMLCESTASITFHLEILAEVDSNWSSFTEMLFIAALRSNDRRFGYNVTDGGEGTLGHRHRRDTKERIRQKMTNRPVTDDFRKKIGRLKQGNQNCLGLKRSQKYKDAVRSRMLGNQNAKGCVRSAETRLKMSLAAKRRGNAEDHRGQCQGFGDVLQVDADAASVAVLVRQD
jgi:hypothetical protein